MSNSIETVINKYGFYSGNIFGDSMFPLLKYKTDVVYLEKPSENYVPKKYDIILYRRNSGQLVLHRIVNVSGEQLVICGDGETTKEYGVTKEQIIAVLTKYYRGEKPCTIDGFFYRLYSKYWCATFFTRKFKLKILKFINRLLGYMKNGRR